MKVIKVQVSNGEVPSFDTTLSGEPVVHTEWFMTDSENEETARIYKERLYYPKTGYVQFYSYKWNKINEDN